MRVESGVESLDSELEDVPYLLTRSGLASSPWIRLPCSCSGSPVNLLTQPPPKLRRLCSKLTGDGLEPRWCELPFEGRVFLEATDDC